MGAHRTHLGRIVLCAAMAFTACGGDDAPGPFEFVSADGLQGEPAAPAYDADAGRGTAGGERTVEEGDIYRMLDGETLLNLNTYRGLQVIDLSDLARPRIVGRLQVVGTPVELYVVDDHAIVMMNASRSYYGASEATRVDAVEGGLVMTVDLSDRTEPTAVDRAHVTGTISTSRLTRGADAAALYVVSSGWGEWTNADGETVWDSRTDVRSFDVTTADLVGRSELDLGGYVRDIHATPQALLVARHDWGRGAGSRVSVIDISDEDGFMIEGDEVVVAGEVADELNMDIRGSILRVVSGASWDTTPLNHLETYDAGDLSGLVPIDHCTFGEGESLFATIFLDDRAFFVTYERVDPFHAFALDAAGHCEERAEFIVSGWNDYFRPVLGDTRLIGIGVDDAGGRRTMAVSLYDVTDLDDASPLISRAEVEADDSWSEASWDDRAFSVLEDAVSVAAPDGTVETGLVLLPFTGWQPARQDYVAAVQIYTFSAETLTRRGLMEHGSPVRRSFMAADDVSANLSDAELSLYDTSDPDTPAALGRVELAPSYTRLLDYGAYRARLEDTPAYYGWWGPLAERPVAHLDIVRATEHPDRAEPVARLDIPMGARLLKVDSLLVVVDSVALATATWPYEYETTVVVHDLSDPTSPREAGRLTTDRIRPGGYYHGGWWGRPGAVADGCFDCGSYGWWGGDDDGVRVVGRAVVFPRSEPQEELIGIERVCRTWPDPGDICVDPDSCTMYAGGITCRSLQGGPEVCEGSVARCGVDTEVGRYLCEEVDPDTISTRTDCHDGELRRYWTSFHLDVLDLSDPAAPGLADAIHLPVEDEAVSLVGGAAQVFYSYRRPVVVADDPRPHVAYFFRAIDLSTPAVPVLGAPVNVPGQLLRVSGSDIFTRDLRWGDRIAETLIHRLDWRGDRAHLLSSHRFADRQVQSVHFDGAGHLLVAHRPPWEGGVAVGVGVAPDGTFDGGTGAEAELTRLRILDEEALTQLSEVDVDSWAVLNGAVAGRALFQVTGGMLLMNTEDATAPTMQAYFPTRGWPSEILFEGNEILFAAGPYGIYRFDADERNLLTR